MGKKIFLVLLVVISVFLTFGCSKSAKNKCNAYFYVDGETIHYTSKKNVDGFDCIKLEPIGEKGEHNWNLKNILKKNASKGIIDIKEIIIDDPIEIDDASGLFSAFVDLKRISGLKNLKTKRVYFVNDSKLTDIDVADLDVSRIEDMSNMFVGCKSIISLDLSKWDTSKVKSMYEMFYSCSSLAMLDIGNWNTSNVESMNEMFGRDKSLIMLDIGNWNISKVKDMRYMFKNCENLLSLNIEKWNINKEIDMLEMFDNCPAPRPSWYHE